VSVAGATAFLLDEYVGLAPGDPERYRNVIDREFASRVDFAADAVDGPDGQVTDIPEARHLVLVATGRAKAEAVHHMVEGAVCALWPASVLQFHPHATVLLDEAPAALGQMTGAGLLGCGLR
jgi:6-phosphogluconolactonase/glucosamine-6-phosphate isomerase/deaminase